MRVHNLFGSHFCGVDMRQYWADLQLWEEFLNKYGDIRTLVELGTFRGGMTLFLATQAWVRGLSFYTLDRDMPDDRVLKSPFAANLQLRDAFIHGDFWRETHEALLGLLRDSRLKPLMLFVDGGCKREEFNAFVPELASRDYCAVHDYGTEFKPADVEPVAHLLESVYLDECLSPPQPCLTRFWRVR